MDLRRKLTILADAAKYDASCASGGVDRKGAPGALGGTDACGICHTYTPDGRCVSLLKILLTNVCIYDCRYCVNRRSSDVERARFTPDEVVALTLDFYRRNYIEGLFLSSGIFRDPDTTMEQLVEVVRKLRVEHAFRGYVHLKTVAGASSALVEEAGRWADRVSVNVELPTAADLARLAPEKDAAAIEGAMQTLRARSEEASAERGAPAFAPAGQSTQIIVGATETRDADYVALAARLYGELGLKRVYYTAYSPIPGADPRLPPRPPPLQRERRLYEADLLLRWYGFRPEEITPPEAPDLDPDVDPKLAWALRHRSFFPVDVNVAEREVLLRVPGLGARTVARLVAMRRHRAIRLVDLERLRVSLRRVAPFVVTADHNPDARLIDRIDLRRRVAAAPAEQLSLFGRDGGR